MGIITTNLLNRFWKKGIKPIRESLDEKVEVSKIIESTNITEPGFVMDGRTASEEFSELNRKLEDIDTYNNANITEQYDVTMISPENGSTHQGSSYQKIGAKVILNLSIKQLNIGRNTIATLPAGYRPIQTLSFIISDGTETGIASVTIDSSGNIIGYASSSGYLIGYIEYYAMK